MLKLDRYGIDFCGCVVVVKLIFRFEARVLRRFCVMRGFSVTGKVIDLLNEYKFI